MAGNQCLLTVDDLGCINAALRQGQEVRIHPTKGGGFRIVGEKPKVLRKVWGAETDSREEPSICAPK